MMKSNDQTGGNLVLKVLLMIAVSLLMLIPLALVKTRIFERQEYMDESVRDIESSWSREQCLSGPKMVVSYDAVEKDGEGKNVIRKKEMEVFPKTLEYDVDIATQNLHRAIFDVTVYNSTVNIKGAFPKPDFDGKLTGVNVMFSMGDLRGIEGAALLSFGGQQYEYSAVEDGTIGTKVSLEDDAADGDGLIPFGMTLKIKGSGSMEFKPVGDLTSISMKSNCSTPSFIGEFLPAERDVRDDGFEAEWVVSHINRGAPESTSFGVRLLKGVTQYQQTTRSAKYGLLIVLLVFLAAFLVELFTRKEINIIQYLVTGLSLVLFYALLLAFSEIMSFGLSYLLAAAMTVIALTAYFRGILKSSLAYLIGALAAIAYGVSYILLQMETYAFLAGTLVLFVCLAAVMYFTKDLGWINRKE